MNYYKNIKYDSDKVDKLAQDIMRHKNLYYAGTPQISDYEYDKIEKMLRVLSSDHPVLNFVGTSESIIDNKVKHEIPMLSLQKLYDEKDLFDWIGDQKVVGTCKIDGNSLSIIYSDGQLVCAKTRGNGRIGEDVTDKVRWISNIVPYLENGVDIEVRGELCCSLIRFGQLAEEMVLKGLERPVNPRNIVAGILGRKNYIDLARYFSFKAFDVIGYIDDIRFKRETDKFKWLEDIGFEVPQYQVLSSIDEVKHYLDAVKVEIDSENIAIDGAVFTYDDLNLHNELGCTSHHPRYKMSFKWQGETAISRIRKITWSTSRLGIVTPVAVIEPVVLSGAQITNVTLHNCLNVRNHRIKVDDEIEIVRSGEVIPKFLRIVNASDNKQEEPSFCPSCGSSLKFDGVRLKCNNKSYCPAQVQGAILNWIEAVEIDDLSEKRLEKMIEHGLVKSVVDLYRLKKNDFLSLPATKEKMAEKLYINIQSSKKLTPARFLMGLGIEGVGLVSWEKLLSFFHTIEKLQLATVEQIEAVDGFANKSARHIVDGLRLKSSLIEELLSIGVSFDIELNSEDNINDVKDIFGGKSIAITGKLSCPRSEIENIIKNYGGNPTSSVSKNTLALISNEQDSNSSKMQKAKKFNVPIWNEKEFFEKVNK